MYENKMTISVDTIELELSISTSHEEGEVTILASRIKREYGGRFKSRAVPVTVADEYREGGEILDSEVVVKEYLYPGLTDELIQQSIVEDTGKIVKDGRLYHPVVCLRNLNGFKKVKENGEQRAPSQQETSGGTANETDTRQDRGGKE